MHLLDFFTSSGIIRFIIWDTVVQKTLSIIKNRYYIGVDCDIIMYDVNSIITYDNIPKWHKDIRNVCKDIPFVM